MHRFGGLSPWLAVLLTVGVIAASCTLDFEKFQGEAPTSTTSGGSGGSSGGAGGAGGSGGVIPASCTNMVMDGEETDEDCGGTECPGCANGLDCLVSTDCRSGYCNGGQCAPCADHPDCSDVPDTWCDLSTNGGQCVPAKATGSPCAGGAECVSSNCADDFCCDLPCAGECEACSSTLTGGESGTCTPIPAMQDPEGECAPDGICNGSAACVTFCGFQPTPPGGTCPGVCTGGCAGGTCIIDCNPPHPSCLGTIINCPAGFACTVQCFDSSSCRQAVVNCPGLYPCSVDCTGQSGCWDATINCASQGTCDLSCGSASAACRDTSLICGSNACTATCAGSDYLPILGCGTACSCTSC